MSQLQQIAARLRALAQDASPLSANVESSARQLKRLRGRAEALSRSGVNVGPLLSAIRNAEVEAQRAADGAAQVKAEGVAWADQLAGAGGSLGAVTTSSGGIAATGGVATQAGGPTGTTPGADAGTGGASLASQAPSTSLHDPLDVQESGVHLASPKWPADYPTFWPRTSPSERNKAFTSGELKYTSIEQGFLWGPDPININTPRQGSLGDCYLIAGLCALAHTEPVTLQSFVQEGEGWVQADSVMMSPGLPAVPGPEGDMERPFGQAEVGHAISYIEKAWAAKIGSYEAAEGGWPGPVLEWITGRQSWSYNPSALTGEQLKSRLASGRPMVTGTHTWPRKPTTGASSTEQTMRELGNKYRVVSGHAYAVRGVDTEGRVVLHNPWQEDHPKPLPLETYQALFASLTGC